MPAPTVHVGEVEDFGALVQVSIRLHHLDFLRTGVTEELDCKDHSHGQGYQAGEGDEDDLDPGHHLLCWLGGNKAWVDVALSAAAIKLEAGLRGVALAGDVPFVRSAVSMLALEKKSNLLSRGLLGAGLARFLCAGQSELGHQVPRWGLSMSCVI